MFLFQERSLAGSESEREKGVRVFKSHDQQGEYAETKNSLFTVWL